MLSQVYNALRDQWPDNTWLQALCERGQAVLSNHPHGDLPRWFEALRRLPRVNSGMQADRSAPVLGADAADLESLRETLMEFHPWRKGPVVLGGVRIDTEWRSDWKWERLRPHLDFAQRRVLDIGCGNGYFGWRMLAAGARLVAGIDPMLVFVMQWLACRHFAGEVPNYVLPLAVEDLPPGRAGFDTVVSMGVLYHRRDPGQFLEHIHRILGPGGTLVLESLVLTDDSYGPVLVPDERYARMRNVFAIPSSEELLRWVYQAGFATAKQVNVSVTRSDEQRTTAWMQFESLAQALHSEHAGRTLEGYPAPARALIIAQS